MRFDGKDWLFGICTARIRNIFRKISQLCELELRHAVWTLAELPTSPHGSGESYKSLDALSVTSPHVWSRRPESAPRAGHQHIQLGVQLGTVARASVSIDITNFSMGRRVPATCDCMMLSSSRGVQYKAKPQFAVRCSTQHHIVLVQPREIIHSVYIRPRRAEVKSKLL